jgi:hypothetical protein
VGLAACYCLQERLLLLLLLLPGTVQPWLLVLQLAPLLLLLLQLQLALPVCAWAG